jgi:hypothetical protein
MIAGAGLMAVSGGAINPMTAGLLVGGLRTAQSGSLSKGLMAGLGAYGGAGLSGGLMSSGASAMNTQAANAVQAANPGLTAGEIGREMGTAGFTQPTIAATSNPALASGIDKFSAGFTGLGTEAGRSAALGSMGGGMGAAKIGAAAALPLLIKEPKTPEMAPSDKDMGQRYSFTGNQPQATPAPDVPSYDDMLTKQGNFGRQQNYFATPTYTPINASQAKDLYHFAGGGPVEQMSNNSMMGLNTMYPMANITTSSYGTPDQMAEGGTADDDSFLAAVGRSFGVQPKKEEENPGLKYAFSPEQQQYVQQQAGGGLSDARYNLGGYSDGGRLLRGPGDGVSDSIPATIGNKQPARLADGEFVVPARIVSELGNGSTEAGARKLYAMMDRVQAARKKTVGKNKVAHNSRAEKYLPA